MRKKWLGRAIATAGAAGTLLLSVMAASPALATDLTLVCDPQLGETLVNGTCVLPGANVGQQYQGIIEASNGTVDTFTLTSGSLPPGLSMPSRYNAFGTIVAGMPTQEGTYTFTVNAVAPNGSSAQQAYSVTVDPPLPLTISSTSPMSPGTVGTAYAQNFLWNGGVAPYTWSVISGQLPPGLALRSTFPPQYNNNQLAGTPTTAGTFTFTMQLTDGRGAQATQQFSLTING